MKKIREILTVVLKNFSNSDILTLSNDLTYVTLIAIFPFFAIILGFSRGFGLDILLLNKINELIPTTDKQLNFILDITRNLLDSLSSGLLAGLGIVLVFWTVIGLLQKIELSFNKIWKIKPSYAYLKNVMNYIAIIILVPIFLIIFIATNDKLTSQLVSTGYLSNITIFIFLIIKLAILLVFFTFIYQKVPNTNVTFKSSAISAFVVIIVLYILSYFYRVLIVMISKYNAIYGSLAFIPLFLLWVKYLWVIILTGAHITYSLDTNFESDDKDISLRYKKSICVYILYKLIKRFEKNMENYTVLELSKEIKVKNYVVRLCVEILENMGYIISNGDDENIAIQINKNPFTLTVADFVLDYENEDLEEFKVFKDDIPNIEVNEIYNILKPCDNKLIKDVLKEE